MALDGTILDAPDTPANREAFHRASGSRGEGGFPQVRKVSLVELSTHVEAAFAMGGWQNSESTLAASLLDRIPTDALLILDRGFFSFKLWKSLRKRNIAVLMRVKSQLVLQPIKRLKDGSFIARIYPNGYDRSQDRNGIEVRLIEYTISDPERPGYGEKHRLVTSLLDEREFPALEIVTFYHEQWEIELTFDEQKTHLDPIRASKPAQLRSETPLGVEQEVLALSLAHFVIRALMFEAAQRQKIDPDRLSFTGCLHVLRAQLPECPPGATETQLRHWYDNLLWHLGQERTEPRRNRSNPRVVKRKMSRFGQKRPKHRPRPKSTKTFAETIVIT